MNFNDAANILGLTGDITRELVKAAYRRLASKFHPDKHPGNESNVTELMKAVNGAYEYFTAHDWTQNSYAHNNPASSNNDWAETLFDIIEKVRVLPEISIEVCGSWLWITGDTRAVKDILKTYGCKYASRKQAWFYCPESTQKRTSYGWTMDKIRSSYGSQEVEKRESMRFA